MRFLAVFLTLVIFAGSRASPVSETQQPESIIQDYVVSLLNVTRQQWDSIRNSEWGQDFMVLVTNFAGSVNTTRAEIVSEVQKFAKNLGVDVNPFTDELAGRIDLVLKEGPQTVLAALKKVHEGTADVMETLRQRMASITEGGQRYQISERLLGLLGEEQMRQVQQNVVEFQQNVKKYTQRKAKPMVQQMARKFTNWAEAAQKSFSDLGSQFNSLWNAFQ